MESNFSATQVFNEESFGYLQVQVLSAFTNTPISGATVTIEPTQEIEAAPESDIDVLTTDTSGQTESIPLDAPPLRFSEEPSDVQPFADYSVRITAPGFREINVIGTQIFTGQQAIQPITLQPTSVESSAMPTIIIPPNTLFGDFPPKTPEDEIKPLEESGEIVLSRVVVPEIVVVHDGVPSNSSAPNYFVPYKDYIKNVASCEIYSTWPGGYTDGKYSGDNVLYLKQGLYGMVPE